jgi:ribosomal protein L20A (L18A)
LLALKYKLALGKNQAVHKVYSDIGVDHSALPEGWIKLMSIAE